MEKNRSQISIVWQLIMLTAIAVQWRPVAGINSITNGGGNCGVVNNAALKPLALSLSLQAG